MISLVIACVIAIASDGHPPIVIRHVTVIDTTGGPALLGRTVVVSGGLIAQVVVDDAYSPVSPDAKVIDATGKFLIPGLWDMHVHLASESGLPLFLANGVTGVRVMWGNPAMTGFPVPHTAWRKAIDAGTKVGPRMIIASNILDGPRPIWPGSVAIHNEAEARKAVRDAVTGGADFIKVYSMIEPGPFRAIADEAKMRGISFAGHVPTLLSATEASNLGQKSMEHLYGIFAACSPLEAEMLVVRKTILEETKGDWFAARAKLGPIDARLRDTYRDDLAAALFARLKANNTWQCPTLIVLRSLGSMNDPDFIKDDRLKYIDPFVRLYWDPRNDSRFKSMKAEDYAAQRKSFERGLELVGKMHRAGVSFLAGTDEANPYVFPGFSLHDELALLVKAGFSPLDALQTATLNPARYLGREAIAGSVAPGKEADLILLDADPTLDIANTKRIYAVFARGRFRNRAALDEMLKSADATRRFGPKPSAGLLPSAGACPDH